MSCGLREFASSFPPPLRRSLGERSLRSWRRATAAHLLVGHQVASVGNEEEGGELNREGKGLGRQLDRLQLRQSLLRRGGLDKTERKDVLSPSLSPDPSCILCYFTSRSIFKKYMRPFSISVYTAPALTCRGFGHQKLNE